MRKSYELKITDDKYYEKMRYVGETTEDAKIRVEAKRLKKKISSNV